ncbi:LOW QUALITY PROTEIN: Hypothetical protein PHPALM_19664 [Phytophthora palmivora]|uniref:Uncharacterized protein n=1 Tax=Phytophthora palmivora TaxID=4796 RepID=A0A2P4XGV1_9STRA|nr:LOW QUALITY PROTEIN: Hypothetical protein PHPALM_19664 [Phytophthora palmivora]
MIFMNCEGKHPIRGVNDNVLGVCYCAKMLDDINTFSIISQTKWQNIKRRRKKGVFLDNCSGPPEANGCREDLDADSYDLRTRQFRASKKTHSSSQKSKMLGRCTGTRKDGATKAVRAVNHQKDKYGLLYAYNVMVRCGLSLGLNGMWSEK